MTADNDNLRLRKKQRTRAALQEAAWRLIDENGFEATTVQAIAEEADLAERTFFRHFESKEAVLFAEHSEKLVRLEQVLAEYPATMSIKDGIGVAVRAIIDAYLDDQELVKNRMKVAATNPSVRAYAREVLMGDWERTICRWIEGRLGVTAEDPRPPFLARVAVASMITAVEVWMRRGFVGDLRAIAREALDELAVIASDQG